MAARILIADDNPTMRNCVGKLVGSHSEWEVCGEATDGRQAVELARKLAPDILILDFRMPGINGLDAARQIVEVSPGTAIVLCTICLSTELIELARAVGIAGAISKNNLNRLVMSIEALLNGNSFYLCDRCGE